MCSEDCAFCSQSARASSQAPHYPLLPQAELVAAARQAAAAGASRFSLVTAGRGVMSPRDQSAILAAVAAIKEAVPIRICASLGIVDRGFLMELKAAGLYRFHHNLETAASFFPKICTTHSYAERVATIEQAQEAGLSVCAGGIFGLGETLAQRWEMAQTLKTLGVDAIPLNFLHPLAGTALAHRPLLYPLEALKIVCGLSPDVPGALGHHLRRPPGHPALFESPAVRRRGRCPDDRRLPHHPGPPAR